MNESIVEFQTNVPQQIALLYVSGRRITTKGGPRVMFTVQGGRKLFVDPPVAEQIAALGVGKGEPISICKRETGFEVSRIPSGEPTAKTASRPPEVLSGKSLSSGCDHHSAPSAALRTEQSPFLLRQLIAAVEAVAATEKHAELIGRPVTFSSEDIRALAISGFIQQSKEGL